MAWRLTEKTQPPAALLITNILDFKRFFLELKSKSNLYLDSSIARGDDWIVLFGQDISGETILPHIPESIALYQSEEDVWMAVGTKLNLPRTVQSDYMTQFRVHHNISERPIIIVPQFGGAEETEKAEIFHINDTVMLKFMVSEVAV